MELRPARRKRSSGKLRQKHQPLPVLIENVLGIAASDSFWPVYIGTYNGDSVVISSSEEISSLYNMGYFGKGCLSTGCPTFESGDRRVAPPVLLGRQWIRRKQWMEQLFSFTGSSYFQQIIQGHGLKRKLSSEKEIEENEKADKLKSNNTSNDGNMVKKISGPDRNEENNGISQMEVDVQSMDNTEPKLGSNEDDSNVVIVVADDEIEDDDDDKSILNLSKVSKLCNEPVKTAVETLNLSLEEAFFLSYGLGCLQVVDLQGKFLSLIEMWRLYIESQPDFISSYVVYHYYRTKGWVVKTGAKFGGKYMLYKKGPPFYHASYIVMIQDVDKEHDNSSQSQSLSWTDVLALNRISESAAKEVLHTVVQWPSDIPKEEFLNPKVISKFRIQEVILRRWNSSQQREEKEYT